MTRSYAVTPVRPISLRESLRKEKLYLSCKSTIQCAIDNNFTTFLDSILKNNEWKIIYKSYLYLVNFVKTNSFEMGTNELLDCSDLMWDFYDLYLLTPE